MKPSCQEQKGQNQYSICTTDFIYTALVSSTFKRSLRKVCTMDKALLQEQIAPGWKLTLASLADDARDASSLFQHKAARMP
jgi:hypothetical protein